MSNPKDCIHCCDYEDMGCKMPVCEFDFPSINTPKCNGCSKFIKRDLVQVVRCKDCRWFENDGYHTNCQIMRFCVEAKDYCSRGERRGEQDG